MKLLVLLVALAGCAHVPNPGQVILSCALDAVKDPRVQNAFVAALSSGNWQAAVAALIATLGPAGEEIAICVISSFVQSPAPGAAASAAAEHGREFLRSRGVVLP